MKKFNKLLETTTNKEEIKRLYKTPDKIKYYPSIKENINTKNYIHQIDIIEFTNDNDYKYILSVIDIYDSQGDARPLKTKNMFDCIKSLKDIYNNNNYGLNYPEILQADNAFNNSIFKAFCNKHNIHLRISLPYNHTQQAYIENYNKYITYYLSLKQIDKEISTNEINTSFKDDLPEIIKLLNEDKEHINKREDMKFYLNNDYLIKIGSIVKIKNYIPRAYITQKALRPPLRQNDYKWSKDNYIINDRFLIPRQPPLYQVKSLDGEIIPTFFTDKQLQLI